MRPPAEGITIHQGWSRIMADEEWVVWDDPKSQDWWHTSVMDLSSGAIFAILYDDYRMDNHSDVYALFIGTREGHETVAEDLIPELGKTAIAVYSTYFHGLHGPEIEDEAGGSDDLTVH